LKTAKTSFFLQNQMDFKNLAQDLRILGIQFDF